MPRRGTPVRRTTSRRFDRAKLLPLLRAAGYLNIEDLHRRNKSVRNMPSRSTVQAMFAGVATESYGPVLEILGRAQGTEDELLLDDRDEAVVQRISEHLAKIDYAWLGTEEALRESAASSESMIADTLQLDRSRSTLDSHDLYLLGKLCVDLSNLVWRVSASKNKEATIGTLLANARICADRIREAAPEKNCAILAGVHNNELTTQSWCEPDEVLKSKDLEEHLRQFDLARVHALHAESVDPSHFGSRGIDTLDHLLSVSFVNVLGREFQPATRHLDEIKDQVASAPSHVKGYYHAFRGLLAEHQGLRDQAISHYERAVWKFASNCGNSPHHTVACCRQRIRGLGDQQRDSLEEDRNVLLHTRVQRTDLLDLPKFQRRIREPWRR